MMAAPSAAHACTKGPLIEAAAPLPVEGTSVSLKDGVLGATTRALLWNARQRCCDGGAGHAPLSALQAALTLNSCMLHRHAMPAPCTASARSDQAMSSQNHTPTATPHTPQACAMPLSEAVRTTDARPAQQSTPGSHNITNVGSAAQASPCQHGSASQPQPPCGGAAAAGTSSGRVRPPPPPP
jgi:hypothetical protein